MNEVTMGITAGFIFFMVVLAYMDFSSFSKSQKENSNVMHKDYKSIIVSMGVLGTFSGIILGLWNFDTTSIKESVPLLLEGLKTAFITSVAGMGLSILLSIMQKFKGHGEAEDELVALNTISAKLENLNRLDDLKHLETLPLMNTKLDSIDTNIKVLSQDISSVKEELRINQSQLFEYLEKSLKDISHSLDDALSTLAEGANKEIIQALEQVIKDFNNNLTQQFGDNFEQLNEAVKEMIVWQNNHKNNVAMLQDNLEKSNVSAINNLNEAVAITQESNKATKEVINEASNQALKTFEEMKNVSSSIIDMTNKYERIAEVSSKLESVITTNENQINNLEVHLGSLKSLGEDAKGVVTSVEDFSKHIQGSLTQQAQTLTTLMNEIEVQLPKTTDTLNETLTSMIKSFLHEYQMFTDKQIEMMKAA